MGNAQSEVTDSVKEQGNQVNIIRFNHQITELNFLFN